MSQNVKKLICAIGAILFMTITVIAVNAERLNVYNKALETMTEVESEPCSEECSSENEKEETSEEVKEDVSENTSEKDETIILGDVNGDGRITAADARLALRASAQIEVLTAEQALAADVDLDGKITAADARNILRYSAMLIDSFPVK